MRVVLGLLIALWATDAAHACGPALPSIERNAHARVWVADGVLTGCHRMRAEPVRLGRRANVREVRLAGRFAGVRTRDLLVIHDLRRGRIERMRRTRGAVTRWILDRGGVAAWLARRDDGDVVVGSSIEGVRARAADIDPHTLGLAGTEIAYRRGDTYEITPLHDDDDRDAAATVLLRVGPVRIEVLTRRWTPFLYARIGARRRWLGEPTGGCWSHNGCGGTNALQVAGRYVATRYNQHNPDYASGSITVRAVGGGPARRYCDERGDVGAFVLTRRGTAACALQLPGRPPSTSEVRVADEVVARGTGIDIHSLHRRGDELVWLDDDVEQTAPLP
jgi:hypothetical protein